MLLYDIDKLARHDIEVAHIALQMRVPPNLPYVNADGDQLRQVFLHVVKNAVGSMHDTPEGDRRLIIEALPAGPHVQITFSDSGPGFVDPSRAFDPFYTTRHQGEGMGLGLSICYSIIREHGGEISAVNLLPRGAAVVIELAIAAPEPPSIPLPDLNASPATP
jgi:signal transduction histidine kinase